MRLFFGIADSSEPPRADLIVIYKESFFGKLRERGVHPAVRIEFVYDRVGDLLKKPPHLFAAAAVFAGDEPCALVHSRGDEPHAELFAHRF